MRRCILRISHRVFHETSPHLHSLKAELSSGRRSPLGPVSRTSRLQWPSAHASSRSAVCSRSRLLNIESLLCLSRALSCFTRISLPSCKYCAHSLSHRTSLVSQSVERFGKVLSIGTSNTDIRYSHTPPLALVPVRGGTGRRNPRGEPCAGTCILVHTLTLSVRPSSPPAQDSQTRVSASRGVETRA